MGKIPPGPFHQRSTWPRFPGHKELLIQALPDFRSSRGTFSHRWKRPRGVYRRQRGRASLRFARSPAPSPRNEAGRPTSPGISTARRPIHHWRQEASCPGNLRRSLSGLTRGTTDETKTTTKKGGASFSYPHPPVSATAIFINSTCLHRRAISVFSPSYGGNTVCYNILDETSHRILLLALHSGLPVGVRRELPFPRGPQPSSHWIHRRAEEIYTIPEGKRSPLINWSNGSNHQGSFLSVRLTTKSSTIMQNYGFIQDCWQK